MGMKPSPWRVSPPVQQQSQNKLQSSRIFLNLEYDPEIIQGQILFPNSYNYLPDYIRTYGTG
jgi:hypothetical protein